MDRTRLHRWELAVLMGLSALLLSGVAAGGRQAALAQRLVRLHVVAASDTPEDQAVKLKVRDAVLAQAGPLLAGAATREEARRRLEPRLPEIEAAARQALDLAGCRHGVTVSLTETAFPTREYGAFALPAGRYTALQVRIGPAAGRNWWCVVFPPLCAPAASDLPAAAMGAGLSQGQVALITREDGGYALKFKTVELWEALRRAIEGDGKEAAAP